MLPTYNAISLIKEEPLEDGATYPIVVGVKEIEKQQVLKNFKSSNMNAFNAVVYEVLSNVLAQEFDLLVPEPCLIQAGTSFINVLPQEIKKRMDAGDQRIRFGCEYLAPNLSYSPALPAPFLKKYDIETIYAFDCLIFNADRTRRKSNMFIHDRGIYLIDHEKTLLLNEYRFQKIKERHLIHNYKQHVFYDKLKVKQGRKAASFDTFQQYLANLNIDKIIQFYQYLVGFDHYIDNFTLIIDYLRYAKQHSSQYVSILKDSLH